MVYIYCYCKFSKSECVKKQTFYENNIDKKFLDNINKFATVKHIVKKDDKNQLKILEIFEIL